MYERLRSERRAHGQTCETMAHLLGLKSKATYQKKESGVIPLKLEEAKVLANELSTTLDALFLPNLYPDRTPYKRP